MFGQVGSGSPKHLATGLTLEENHLEGFLICWLFYGNQWIFPSFCVNFDIKLIQKKKVFVQMVETIHSLKNDTINYVSTSTRGIKIISSSEKPAFLYWV